MNLTAVPGVALDRALRLWKLPLNLAQAVLGQTDAATWPPAMVYERFEAGTRELVGNFVHDERLLERARLQRLKLAQLDRSVGLEAEAELERQEAERTRNARIQDADQRRKAAQRQAVQREQALERERQHTESKVRKQASERKAQEKRRAEQRREATQVREVAAKKVELDAKAKALTVKDQAVKAKGHALTLEDEADRKKATRKAAATARRNAS